MKTVILKLRPNTRFHFGKQAVDTNTALSTTDVYLHSDMLFSALVNNLATVAPPEEVEQFINAYEEGKIKISSGFYCLEKEGKYTYFFPRPADAPNLISKEEYTQIKKIKKVQMVSHEAIQVPPSKWIIHNMVAYTEETLDKLGLANKTEDFLNKELRIFNKVLTTQVGIRQTNENAKGPFSVAAIQIDDLTGLELTVHFYFLYETTLDKNHPIFQNFELAVQVIRLNGLGGERSSGFGKVESVEFIEAELPFLKENSSNLQMTLSKVIPANLEELKNFQAYTCSSRGGRRTGTQLLKSVRMIDEGALFTSSVEGSIVNLDEEGKYKRNGKCFSISVLVFREK